MGPHRKFLLEVNVHSCEDCIFKIYESLIDPHGNPSFGHLQTCQQNIAELLVTCVFLVECCVLRLGIRLSITTPSHYCKSCLQVEQLPR